MPFLIQAVAAGDVAVAVAVLRAENKLLLNHTGVYIMFQVKIKLFKNYLDILVLQIDMTLHKIFLVLFKTLQGNQAW